VDPWLQKYPNGVAVSAATGKGFPALLAELAAQLKPERDLLHLEVPHADSAAIARLRAVGQVIQERYTAHGARLKARIPPHLRGEFSAYIRRRD
jgi:GTP-binding protein HflX